jgi:hypothetical protein
MHDHLYQLNKLEEGILISIHHQEVQKQQQKAWHGHHIKMKEIDWSKQWKIFIEWGLKDDYWKLETKFLAKVGIRHLLGAPQIFYFERWKEEETKFIVIQFHEIYLWLDIMIEITSELIHRITNIPKMGVQVQKTSNASAWM